MTEVSLSIPPSVELTEFGLVFHGRLTIEEYLGLGTLLFRTKDELQFAVGDLIVYGQDYMPEEWTQILESHYAEQSISNMASVCRRVPHEVRRPHEASFSMHEAIAPLHGYPDLQAKLLDAAITNGWRRNEFRELVAVVKSQVDAKDFQLEKTIAAFNESLMVVEEPEPKRTNGIRQILAEAIDANSRGDHALVSQLLDRALKLLEGG